MNIENVDDTSNNLDKLIEQLMRCEAPKESDVKFLCEDQQPLYLVKHI